MRFIFLLFVVGICTLSARAQQPLKLQFEQRGEVVVKINADNLHLIPNIGSWSIERSATGDALVYLNSEQYNTLLSLDIPFTPEIAPSLLYDVKMAAATNEMEDWDSYPDYDTYIAMMQQFAANYPNLCKLDTIGYSKNNRLLLALKISDNVAEDETEPEFFYTSSMHGNELTGYVLMLRLADYLLTNYSDPFVKNLVDNIEIYINPLANPDGTFRMGNTSVSGATRYNANNVDLNRNYPNFLYGEHPDGNEWQPETIAMMDFMKLHNFSLSMNFHGGVEVLNYPWDLFEKRHADTEWFNLICRAYADTVHTVDANYLTYLENGVTNGYDWYIAKGTRQDYVTYYLGGREVTGELSDDYTPVSTELPAFWDKNYKSLLYYMEQSLFGVTGTVVDTQGNPLNATVTVDSHDMDSSQVKTQNGGVFYRYLKEGNFILTFNADGYIPKSIPVTVTDFEQTTVNVVLDKVVSVPAVNELSWRVYPNPADKYLYIETSNAFDNCVVEVYNVVGKLMYSGTLVYDSKAQPIDVSGFMPGIYLVQMRGNGKPEAALKFMVE